jgi:hypothetical protein
VLAKGKDPSSTKVGELGEGKPVTIGADDSIEEALKTMSSHQVRRLPVIDGQKLVGTCRRLTSHGTSTTRRPATSSRPSQPAPRDEVRGSGPGGPGLEVLGPAAG